MVPYSYSPLPQGSNTIRVLRLLPNEEKSAPVECQLLNYNLLNTGQGRHPYEALSYVWGSENQPQSIFIDSCTFSVTKNLYAALLHLRDHQIERVLWIDAICINQQNEREKAYQVQLMTRIYSQSNCVIVWLGAAADNSDEVFEAMHLAVEDGPLTNKLAGSWNDKTYHVPLLKLIQRPWFRRIWVLQEVGVARSILILCGTAKINGYTFFLGLERLGVRHEIDTSLYNIIRPVTYLIQGAIFRTDYTRKSHGTLSIGELIDLYHTHEATKQHDKVYALLGMSSDDPKAAGLLPNYALPWDKLFQQVIRCVIPNPLSVQTWPNKELALIKSEIYILGIISSVEEDGSRFDRKHVQVSFAHGARSMNEKSSRSPHWTLRASAKSIQEGDIVCLLRGAAEPSIIRLCGHYFAIIMIRATPCRGIQGESAQIDALETLYSNQLFSRSIPLIWDWGDLKGDNGFKEQINYDETGPKLSPMALVTNDIAMCAMALEGHETEALKLILDQMGMWVPISEEVVKAAAENKKTGDRIMTLLLDRRGEQLPISEKVVKAAAKNEESGHSIMALLLDRRGEQLLISEEVVKAAAENKKTGDRIMTLLLDRRGEQLPISEEVVKATAENEESGHSIMALLLDRRGEQLPISEEVVKAAAGNCGGHIHRTSSYSTGYHIMKLLLDKRGKQLPISEDVVKAAAENRFVYMDIRENKHVGGYDIIKLLLDRRGRQLPISEEVFTAAAGNLSWCRDEWPNRGRDIIAGGPEIMKLLLDRRGERLSTSEQLVKAAAGNHCCGYEIMKLLADRRGRLLMAFGDKPKKKFLDIRGKLLPISEEVVKAAAANLLWGSEIMRLLLKQRGEQLPISEEVIKTAAGNPGHEDKHSAYDIMLQLVYGQGDRRPISEEVVKAAAGNPLDGYKIMKLFVDERGEQVPISEEVVKAAAGNPLDGYKIMKLFVDERGEQVPISEEVVKAAAGNPLDGYKIMKLFVEERGEQLPISEEVVKIAARNPGWEHPVPYRQSGCETMKLLLDERGEQLPISEEVVKAAVQNRQSGYEIIKLLIDRRGEQLPLSKEVVKAAAQNRQSGYEIIKLLIDRRGEQLPLSEWTSRV